MRRVLLIAALALLGFPAAAGAASVRLVECVPALDGAERSATFEARLHPVRGSERMQVRFTLQVRQGAQQRWRRVAAGDADDWLTSFPGVRRYSYARTVENLSAPASYRMVVRFRWLDADGEVLKRARATSRNCRQPDMRPDIVATAIVPVAGGYEVVLHNRGRSDAGPFEVALAVAAQEPVTTALEGLAAGEQWTLAFSAPACAPGDRIEATVDAAGAVDERQEDDNLLAVVCMG